MKVTKESEKFGHGKHVFIEAKSDDVNICIDVSGTNLHVTDIADELHALLKKIARRDHNA